MMKVAILTLIFCTSVFAGREGTGGGAVDIRKINMINSIERNLLSINSFFSNPQNSKMMRKKFPEVDSGKLHQTITKLILEKKIRLVDDSESKEIFDRYSIARTAVNYPKEGVIEYDLEKVEEAIKHPKVFYVLNFHEVLGLMGLEKTDPSHKDLSLGYKISSRLAELVGKTGIDNYDLMDLSYSKVAIGDYPEVLKDLYVKLNKSLRESDLFNCCYSDEIMVVNIYEVGSLNNRQFMRVANQILVDEKVWDIFQDSEDKDFTFMLDRLSHGEFKGEEHFEVTNIQVETHKALAKMTGRTYPDYGNLEDVVSVPFHESDGSDMWESGNMFYLIKHGLIVRVSARISADGLYDDFFPYSDFE